MKKVLVAALIVTVGLSVGSIAYKAWAIGPGAGDQANVQALKSFQKETLPLRDELAAKGLELRNEYAKENPDQNRIAALQKEMIDLRTKIRDAAQKNGLPDWGPGRGGWGRGYMMGPGYGPGYMMGQGGWGPGYGPGYMMGQGYGRGYRGGYGPNNCPMW